MERKRIGEQLRTKERDTKNDQGISTPLADGYKQTKRERERVSRAVKGNKDTKN